MNAASRKDEVMMTSQEMLARSSSWTLACDNALLNRLKSFSESLTERSQEISKECDKLTSDVSKLGYGLKNVTNEFMMLSNSQFVENRVEEFEEFSASIASSTSNSTCSFKTKSEKEAELMSKMKQAIQLGLAASNEKRQQDEKSINRYKMHRPYIIGSPKFFSSKYCGLVDESRSTVPSETEIYSSDSLSQTSDNMKPEFKPTVTFTMPPTTVIPVQTNQNINQVSSIVSNKQDIHPIYGQNQLPASTSSSGKSFNENLRPSVTDELNETYSSFIPPPTVGLIDDDSDDDFRPSASAHKLFDDDDDLFGEKQVFPSGGNQNEFFGRANPTKHTASVFSIPPPIEPHHLPIPQSPQLDFGNTHTLAGSGPITSDVPNKSTLTDGSKKDAVIRDASDKKPMVETEGSLRSKLPVGAVSMFGGLPPPIFNNGTLQNAEITKNVIAPSLQSKEKENTQISSASTFGTSSGMVGSDSILSSQQPQDVKQNVNSTSQPSLPSNTTTTKANQSSGTSDSVKNRPTTQKTSVKSLFIDDSSDEDIFAPKQIRTQNAKPAIVNNASSSTSTKTQPPIFETYNAFNSTVTVKKPPVKKSIFEDSDSEDDLFTTKPASSKQSGGSKSFLKTGSKVVGVSEKNKKSSSLFGDESDSDTDIFGNKKKIMESTEVIKPVISVKALDSFQSKKDKGFSKGSEPKVSVKALASKLKINPLAMMVGARPPKRKDSSSEPIEDDNSTPGSPVIEDALSPRPEISEVIQPSPKTNEEDKFFNNSKADQNNEKKRTSPSQIFLKSSSSDMDDEKDNPDCGNENEKEKTSPIKVVADQDTNTQTGVKKDEDSSNTLVENSDQENKPESIADEQDDNQETTSSHLVTNSLENNATNSSEINDENQDTSNEVSTKEEVESKKDVKQNENSTSQPSLPSNIKTTKANQDSEETSDFVENRPTQEAPAKSLFVDDSSDEDIFASKKNRTPNTKPEPVNNVISPKSTKPQPPIFEIKKAPKATLKAKKPVKKSIFDDSDSEDGLFSSKPAATKHTRVDKPSSKTESKVDGVSIKKKKDSSLFGDESDSDSDIFSSKKKTTESSEIVVIKPVISEKASDSIQSKKDSKSLSKGSEPKVSVKALASKLKLNPLAMMVGARPPKRKDSSSEPIEDDNSTPGSPVIEDVSSPDKQPEISEVIPPSPKTNDGDAFFSMIKARPKIQKKRRPPSRVFLKSSISDMDDQKVNPDIGNEEEKVDDSQVNVLDDHDTNIQTQEQKVEESVDAHVENIDEENNPEINTDNHEDNQETKISDLLSNPLEDDATNSIQINNDNQVLSDESITKEEVESDEN